MAFNGLLEELLLYRYTHTHIYTHMYTQYTHEPCDNRHTTAHLLLFTYFSFLYKYPNKGMDLYLKEWGFGFFFGFTFLHSNTSQILYLEAFPHCLQNVRYQGIIPKVHEPYPRTFYIHGTRKKKPRTWEDTKDKMFQKHFIYQSKHMFRDILEKYSTHIPRKF